MSVQILLTYHESNFPNLVLPKTLLFVVNIIRGRMYIRTDYEWAIFEVGKVVSSMQISLKKIRMGGSLTQQTKWLVRNRSFRH